MERSVTAESVTRHIQADQNFVQRKPVISSHRQHSDYARNEEQGSCEVKASTRSDPWEEARRALMASHQHHSPPNFNPPSRPSCSRGVATSLNESDIRFSNQGGLTERSSSMTPRNLSTRVSSIYAESQMHPLERSSLDRTSRPVSYPHSTNGSPPKIEAEHHGPIRNHGSHRMDKPYFPERPPRRSTMSNARAIPTPIDTGPNRNGTSVTDRCVDDDGILVRCRKLDQQVRRQAIHIAKFEQREAELLGELSKLGNQWNAFHHREMQREATSFREYFTAQIRIWEDEKNRELELVRQENHGLTEKLKRADKVNELNQRGKSLKDLQSSLTFVVHERNMNSIDKLIQDRMSTRSDSSQRMADGSLNSPISPCTMKDPSNEASSHDSIADPGISSDPDRPKNGHEKRAIPCSESTSKPGPKETAKPLKSPLRLVDGILPKPVSPQGNAKLPTMRKTELQARKWPGCSDKPVLPQISVDISPPVRTSSHRRHA